MLYERDLVPIAGTVGSGGAAATSEESMVALRMMALDGSRWTADDGWCAMVSLARVGLSF